jgi:hypothetical protein
MGFKTTRVTYALEFEEPALQGLEVEVRSVSLGAYLNVVGARRLANLQTRRWNDDDSKALAGLYDAFARALVAWNLEDDARECGTCRARWFDEEDTCPNGHDDWVLVEDAPVPPTRENVYAQDMTLMLPVGLAWLNAVGAGQVREDGDLGKDSAPGPNAQEASIPMDVLSTSPAS